MTAEMTVTERQRKIVKDLRHLANEVQSLPILDLSNEEEKGEELPIGVKFLGAVGCCWLYYESTPGGPENGCTFEPTHEQGTEILNLLADWFKRCAEAGSFKVKQKETRLECDLKEKNNESS